ncbi:recombinase family protein [Salinivibrio sp. DV]|uniref:recombinase family protein n=1 Tax=Salinivibrio sp. SS2 TaxID=1892894 RepID=UPI00084C053E|nr:recombinase family protein [Salinivibrio sp. DV]ODQ00636.1 serine recombinase [Salinivibrio sp. DV]
MYIHAYLRASTSDQDANRAKNCLIEFVEKKGLRIASWYTETKSGASLQRPELMRLLRESKNGDAILVEQIDRLSRLNESDWLQLKNLLAEKNLKVIALDLPTSHLALSEQATDSFTQAMLSAINGMMIDMLAAISRKDYEDRRRRQAQGIEKAKNQGKYRGRKADAALHEKIYKLRVLNGLSINETAELTNVSARTVIRIAKAMQQAKEI